MDAGASTLRRIPSVDEILKTSAAQQAVAHYGRPRVVEAIRQAVAAARCAIDAGKVAAPGIDAIAANALAWLEADARPNARAVFNLTGTVLHTNLGRAVLADAAIEAATVAMREAMALEFDLAQGRRGERDALVRGLLCELTGAEDATVVNNNAAAVLLALNTLAKGKEAIVSRGELIEIGGAFRMPEIMARAGAKLVEVGTTNRTHEKDYAAAISPKTGLILKVHTSNYRIEGFTKSVTGKAISALARASHVPLLNDLGSGTLVDLSRYGLTHEQTVAEAVGEGADLVTFSGDKLLGGPQAGFIVGRRDLIARLNRNPMKRALRIDKIRLAAIEATLRLYRDPDRLAERLPTLRLMARPLAEIEAAAQRVLPAVAAAVGPRFVAEAIACTSQIGSGSLPSEVIPGAGIALRVAAARGKGRALMELASALRTLDQPVIGRIENDALILDLRCLEDETAFLRNLATLQMGGAGLMGLRGFLARLQRRDADAPTEAVGEVLVTERMAQAYEAAEANDYESALAIWGPLAHQGVARAQNNIGKCFSDGLGVDRDSALALRWLTLAAEGGDPVGQRNLADVYFKGEGVQANAVQAAELYRMAAEAGDGPAQDMLSWMLVEGEMIPGDLSDAKHWAEAAAAQGIVPAMTRLGMMHHNALGVERDAAAAARWWDKAAALGDADAQAMLGAAYQLGAGVPRDGVAALMWLLRAQAGASPLAEPFIHPTFAALSVAEIERARKLAGLPLPELAL